MEPAGLGSGHSSCAPKSGAAGLCSSLPEGAAEAILCFQGTQLSGQYQHVGGWTR